jgi:DNA-binding protein H-NS
MSIDLSSLSPAEIQSLLALGSKELDRRKKESRGEAIAAVRKTAESYGYKLEELLDLGVTAAPAAEKKTRNPAKILFRSTVNPEDSWSGRGQTPKWLRALESQGRNREEFRIQA